MKNLTKQRITKQKGFTLIELVVVIVILGILAVTAAPKFIDLQGDAKGATISAVKAAIETANAGVHAKSLIAGNNTTIKANNPTVTVAGSTIEIGSGWMLATTGNFSDLMDIDSVGFTTLVSVADDTVIVVFPAGFAATADDAIAAECYVSYAESTNSNTKPIITVDIDLCQ